MTGVFVTAKYGYRDKNKTMIRKRAQKPEKFDFCAFSLIPDAAAPGMLLLKVCILYWPLPLKGLTVVPASLALQ